MRVYIRHARKAEKRPYCSQGIRIFCKQYNIDYGDFLRNGLDPQVLIDTQDTMALRVVEAARKEYADGAQ